jgi:ParB-like chromosome segregation protein Spo0J
MKIKEVPIDDVIPYEKNPRIIPAKAVEQVARSIERYGFRQPIVVDTDMVILAGHTRWRAAKKLKRKTVPVHIAENLTEDQRAAYRLADNKSQEQAEWDQELLGAELAELRELESEPIGFDDLAALREEAESDEPIIEKYHLVIECPDQETQKEIFDEIKKRGIPCRLINT